MRRSAFKENMPSLMTASNKGDHNFKVHRIDAEYKAERPISAEKKRRRKREEDGGDKEKENN